MAGVLALGLGSLAFSPSVHADDWCFNDPIVSVNGHQAAINIGIRGSVADVTSSVRAVEIQVFVPKDSRNRIVNLQNGPFRDEVHFTPTGDSRKVGEIDVRFELNPGKTPKDASVQVTQNGRTTTTMGKTREGLTAHMDVD